MKGELPIGQVASGPSRQSDPNAPSPAAGDPATNTPAQDGGGEWVDCWQCGGEGEIANCWDEFACFDPESGCDECRERCDICKGKCGWESKP